jgi:YhcH/YjgK/YiaL family protein
MIIDRLENLEKYVSLNPLFKEVVDFLKANKLENLDAGKHLIKGEDVFVNIQEVKGKTQEQAVIEYHKSYIDIQVPLTANETYGYMPTVELPEAEFSVENDMAKVPCIMGRCYVTCTPGMFVIFFPQDGHAPCICDKAELRKAIFKVKVS